MPDHFNERFSVQSSALQLCLSRIEILMLKLNLKIYRFAYFEEQITVSFDKIQLFE